MARDGLIYGIFKSDQPSDPKLLMTSPISKKKLASIFPRLNKGSKIGKGEKKMKLRFQKGNIPKNRTPYLFSSIFSSEASDAAQFGR